MRKNKEIEQLKKDAPFVTFPKEESSPGLDKFNKLIREVLEANVPMWEKFSYIPRDDRYNEGGYYEVLYKKHISMPPDCGFNYVEDAEIRFRIDPFADLAPQINGINERLATLEEWERRNRMRREADELIAEAKAKKNGSE